MMNTASMETGHLSKRRILSVQCPVCKAKPRERCTFATGQASDKTHLDRGRAAAKASRPANFVYATLESLRALTSRGLRVLFHSK